MILIPEEYTVTQFYQYGYRATYCRSNKIYNCACPICREGKSLQRKKRCFYIPDKDLIFCHNCGWSSRPWNWIKEVSGKTDSELYADIASCDYDVGISFDEVVEEQVVEIPTLPEDCINLYDEQQLHYYRKNAMVQDALSLIKARKLDTAENRCDTLYYSLKDKVHRHRLIIPFKDTGGDIIFYQSRKIFNFDKKENYISKMNGDRSIFNIDKVVTDIDDIFIFEGPIDSLFVKNGVAVGGITERGSNMFTPVQNEQMNTSLFLFNKIWVLDSQWLDKTALSKSEILMQQGENIFIWPHAIGSRYKDFNQMCVSLDINGISSDYIKKHTFNGDEGVLKLKQVRDQL